jgi:hypothetical protein
LHDADVALRVHGDDLIPDEITRLLGAEPTSSHAKGDRNVGGDGREYAPWRSGIWVVSTGHQSPGNIDQQVSDILGHLSPDLSIWRELSARFRLDLYCGLFLALSNERAIISVETLNALGGRGIELVLEIYAPDDEPQQDQPCPCYSGKVYADCHGYRGT